jgi:hypothetical protein
MGGSIGRIGAAAAVLVALVLPLRASLAWGPEAHRAIALIAERHLQQSDPAVRAKILAILATDKGSRLTKNDIGGEATWADVLREKSEEARSATGPWHVTRFGQDNPDLGRACYGRNPLPEGYPASHGPRENCSVDKVEQFAKELRDPATSAGERLAALQFLLNLVGDLNDPLLAIDHGDQGGECVAVQIGATSPVRLSTYWQETLVAQVIGSDPATGAARIVAAVPAAEAQKWAEGNAESWARDAFDVAKSVTYNFGGRQPEGKQGLPPRRGEGEGCPAGADLYRVGPDYETKALAAVKTQLAKAGLRLARELRDSLK